MTVTSGGYRQGSERPSLSQHVDMDYILQAVLAHRSVMPPTSNLLCFHPPGRHEGQGTEFLTILATLVLPCARRPCYRTCRASFYKPSPAFLQPTREPTCWGPGVPVKAQEAHNHWGHGGVVLTQLRNAHGTCVVY